MNDYPYPDAPSPILLRRRLSVPEIVMRKHSLHQQYSYRDHFDHTSKSDPQPYDSDSNLNRRRDADLMRKSTLLRRFWGNHKMSSLKFSSPFYEWQHSVGKLSLGKSTSSLRSNHSSSEHLNNFPRKNRFDSDSTNRQASPKRNVFKSYLDNSGSKNVNSNTSEDDAPISVATNKEMLNFFSRKINKSSDISHLNVISNVKLSESTLDTIFNQVIDDIDKTKSRESKVNNNVPQEATHYVPKESSCEAKDDNTIAECLISNIDANPYSNPPDVPQVVVPRYSALPRTTSMEVNMSSGGDSDGKESDTLSLVDSLDDPNSPRLKDSLPNEPSPIPLPDNSETHKASREDKKSSTFFIPIEDETTEPTNSSALTELLPGKVREKLSKRQEIREKKSLQMKQKLEATNQFREPPSKCKKKFNSILPKLDPAKQVDSTLAASSRIIRNSRYYYENNVSRVNNKQMPKKLTPILTNCKAKHVECEEQVVPHLETNKSRIPVPIQSRKVSRNVNKIQKPTFLDNDYIQMIDNPKLDQLIANILIDTLNNPQKSVEPVEAVNNNNVEVKEEEVIEVPPEPPKVTETAPPPADPPPANSIPKGWITFYLLEKHNNLTSDSSSDEVQVPKFDLGKANEQVLKNNNRCCCDVGFCPKLDKEGTPKTDPLQGQWSMTVRAPQDPNTVTSDIRMQLKLSHTVVPLTEKNIYKQEQGYEDEMSSRKKYRHYSRNSLRVPLPQIHQTNHKVSSRTNAKSNRSVLITPRLLGTKQTRTSTNRYYLSRPHGHQHYPPQTQRHLPRITTKNLGPPPQYVLYKHYPKVMQEPEDILSSASSDENTSN